MKDIKILRIIIVVFLIPLITQLLSYLITPAFAQNFSLSISPPILEVMIKPGKTITYVYKLTNQGATTQIYADVTAFEPSDELGNTNLNFSSQPFLSWFSFQNADISLPGGFLLKSGGTQELVLKIRVPEKAEEKDYYASLYFLVNASEKPLGLSAIKSKGIIASHILLTVSENGLPERAGKITEFIISKCQGIKVPKLRCFLSQLLNLSIFDSFDTIPFTLKVANTGQTVWQPIGSIKILNPFNKEVEFLEILAQNVLAQSQRQLFIKGNEETISQEISWQPRGLSIGKHTALASFYLSDSQNKIEQEISFILIPWKAGLGLLIAFLVICQYLLCIWNKKIIFRANI